jgi:hypothetical protein
MVWRTYPRPAWVCRWHIPDPIRFDSEIRVTIQDLGSSNDKFVTRGGDIASVAFWYQTEPHAPFSKLPDVAQLKVN